MNLKCGFTPLEIRYLKAKLRLPKGNLSLTGFTFIELLITLAVIAICFLPLMRMFSVSLEQVYLTSDLTTGRYLVQEAMEKVKNSGFSERQLADLGDVWEPALNAPPLKLNNRYWRILRRIIKGSDPLEVRVYVYQESANEQPKPQEQRKPIAEVVTLIEDLEWVTPE